MDLGPQHAAVISPTAEEGQLLESLCFPKGCTSCDKQSWQQIPDHDVMVISNVLMYVDDPAEFLASALRRCKWLWLQDGVEGRRGNGDNYLGEDGDRNRFSFTPHWKSGWEGAFDLRDTVLAGRLVEHEVYGLDSPGRHFVALVRGDLCEEKKREPIATETETKEVVTTNAKKRKASKGPDEA